MTSDATQSDNPTRIARETLLRLAQLRVAPTPDNYRQIYNQIVGVAGQATGNPAERALNQLPADLRRLSPHFEPVAGQMIAAIRQKEWNKCAQPIVELLAQLHDGSRWAALIQDLMRQAERRQQGLSAVQKKQMLDRVLETSSADATTLYTRLHGLLQGWAEAPSASPNAASDPSISSVTRTYGNRAALRGASDEPYLGLQDLLSKTLHYGLVSQLRHAPDLAEKAETLALQVRKVQDQASLAEFADALKSLWYKLEVRGDESVQLREGLIHLMHLLLENMGELLPGDGWLHGQIDAIRNTISGEITPRMLHEAERSIKEVIYKQSSLKHGMDEAKATLKTMIATLINRMGSFSEETGDYHQKLEEYSRRISSSDDIALLGTVLDNILHETRAIQASTLRSRDELAQARKDAEAAELKIRELDQELTQVSGLVRVDPLTGGLNRRGLSDHFLREAARADRHEAPLSLAVIDLDNFKLLNDRLGHQAGDQALVHLVQIIRQILRATDAVARFGGEEFVILLPDTDLDDAVTVITRLQRELTRNFFFHNNEKLLITFSAGVALRAPGEEQDAVLSRADAALYQAKRAGKNRIVAAVGR